MLLKLVAKKVLQLMVMYQTVEYYSSTDFPALILLLIPTLLTAHYKRFIWLRHCSFHHVLSPPVHDYFLLLSDSVIAYMIHGD